MSPTRLILAGLVALLSIGCATPKVPNPFGAQRDPAKILEAYRDQRAEQRAIQDEVLAEERTRAVPVSELVAEGDRYRAQDRLGDAMFLYLRAVRAEPEALGPKLRIGFLHLRDDPGRAVRIFEAILEEAPDAALAHAGLGLAQLAAGKGARARASLERAAEIDPGSATTWNALGVLRDRDGEHALAQAAYRKALAIDAEADRALVNLGASLLLGGDASGALEVLEKADAIAGKDAFVRTHLGLAYGRLGRIDEALAAFRSVTDEPRARNNLGYVLYLNGSYEAAMIEFEHAIGVPPEELPAVLRNWEAARIGPERARLAAARRAAAEAAREAEESAAIEAQREREAAAAAEQQALAAAEAEAEQRALADARAELERVARAAELEQLPDEAQVDPGAVASAAAPFRATEPSAAPFVGPMRPLVGPLPEADDGTREPLADGEAEAAPEPLADAEGLKPSIAAPASLL